MIKRIIIVIATIFVFILFPKNIYAATYIPFGRPCYINEREKNNVTNNIVVNNDMETLVNIANTIGVDRVYNQNYSEGVNKEIKLFYENMGKATYLINNKDVERINNEYINKIASLLGQPEVTTDTIYYLRYSYINKLVVKYKEASILKKTLYKEQEKLKNNSNDISVGFIVFLILVTIGFILALILIAMGTA